MSLTPGVEKALTESVQGSEEFDVF
ncbi:hypothetical protein MGSAQ_003247, partial [marine sediment metagenome]